MSSPRIKEEDVTLHPFPVMTHVSELAQLLAPAMETALTVLDCAGSTDPGMHCSDLACQLALEAYLRQVDVARQGSPLYQQASAWACALLMRRITLPNRLAGILRSLLDIEHNAVVWGTTIGVNMGILVECARELSCDARLDIPDGQLVPYDNKKNLSSRLVLACTLLVSVFDVHKEALVTAAQVQAGDAICVEAPVLGLIQAVMSNGPAFLERLEAGELHASYAEAVKAYGRMHDSLYPFRISGQIARKEECTALIRAFDAWERLTLLCCVRHFACCQYTCQPCPKTATYIRGYGPVVSGVEPYVFEQIHKSIASRETYIARQLRNSLLEEAEPGESAAFVHFRHCCKRADLDLENYELSRYIDAGKESGIEVDANVVITTVQLWGRTYERCRLLGPPKNADETMSIARWLHRRQVYTTEEFEEIRRGMPRVFA